MIDRARWRMRAAHALVLISGALAPVAARAADQPAAAAAPPLVERVQVITTRAPEPVETTPASVTVIMPARRVEVSARWLLGGSPR